MSLRQDILELLREENYPINEIVTDALADFLAVLEDEVEKIDRDMVEAEEQEEEEEEADEGF
jgi:hypothetical protein